MAKLRYLWGDDLRAHKAAMRAASREEFLEYALLEPDFDGWPDHHELMPAQRKSARSADAA